jgi:hypothetical protein
MNNFQFSNGEFEIVNTPQSVYDDFNNFIFSSEIRVFAKLSARMFLYNKIKHLYIKDKNLEFLAAFLCVISELNKS